MPHNGPLKGVTLQRVNTCGLMPFKGAARPCNAPLEGLDPLEGQHMGSTPLYKGCKAGR